MATLSTKQLAEYVVNQIESGVAADDVSRHIAAYLLDQRKSRDASKVMRAIETELIARGHKQVVITSAHPVDDSTKQKLAGLLDVKQPLFSEEIDPSVIGGVRARSGETEIDLTVRGKLNRFKQHVVSGN